jgi:MYXO-CTERM domain-containing protein
VRLLFQSTTREYIEFLRDNAPDSLEPDVDNRGATAYRLWEEHGGMTPTVMAESIAALGASPGACPEPPTDAGADAAIDGGADAAIPPLLPPDDDGCGCTTLGKSSGEAPMWLFGLVALALFRRRPR